MKHPTQCYKKLKTNLTNKITYKTISMKVEKNNGAR